MLLAMAQRYQVLFIQILDDAKATDFISDIVNVKYWKIDDGN